MVRASASFLCIALAGATSAPAELVVMVDGRVLKAMAFTTTDQRARIELPSGGLLTVPLVRVERVVSDELASEADPLEEVFVDLAFRESDQVPDTPYGQLIYDTGKRHLVNPAVIAAIVRADSDFDPNAQSARGARGLMQLMPATARRLGVDPDELFEPETNLDAGVRYLSELGVRYRYKVGLVLAAYKVGEQTVDHHGRVPPFRETRDFIMEIYASLGVGVRDLASSNAAAELPSLHVAESSQVSHELGVGRHDRASAGR